MSRDRSKGVRSFFEPKSVAVAGVSTDPDKLGSIIFANLLANVRRGLLKASVHALNPTHDHIGNQPCYPKIGALPETPELLIVAVPLALTLDLVKEAADAGVKAVIMITSGYAEVGKGAQEKEIGRIAARRGMRILGPNTIGVVDTRSGVDSLFLRSTKSLPRGGEIVSMLKPLEGKVTIITQSGHLGQVISEKLAANGIGIRALVGTGNQLDVSVEEVIQYFAEDENTAVIAVYIEGLREGRSFMRAAAYAAKRKPLVVFKVGKTSVGASAALTHTASLVGDYDVYRAAFRQSGVLEASSLQELEDYCISLSMLAPAAGRRLAIVTNAGGVGAIAADEAERSGLKVEPMGDYSQRLFRSEFKGSGFISNAGLKNPVDLTASASTDEFVRATEAILALPNYDLAIVIPTHQTPAIGSDIASKLGDVISKAGKPVCMCVIGDAEFAFKIQREFMARGIPTFPTPERAARALAAVPAYQSLAKSAEAPNVRPRRPLISSRSSGSLAQPLVSRLLQSYGISEAKSVVVHSPRDLRKLKNLVFPVACKLLSKKLVHKTDVGGVILDVKNADQVESAMMHLKKLAGTRKLAFDGMLVQEMVKDGIEIILGGKRDPTFGPVVMLGPGGIYTELTRDYSLAIAPVKPEQAAEMITRNKLGRVLDGYRGGQKMNVGRLARVVSRFSRIMLDNPRIREIEVNPLMVSKDGILSVDARVILAAAKK
ncbi:MAG TPA: acetate--CoA ligase family protein [Nitrososphaerales archaeon]|nr:acetate--CoA ligase family protein [Nitrososphaerales archaeon]